MTQRQHFLTKEGLEGFQQELEHLKSERRPEVAERIHKATETGGTADNAEYEDAKSEQSFVEGRIRELENLLADAVVASRRKGKAESVEFGSSVTVVNAQGKKVRYRVVGSAEASPTEGKISDESPVGKALLGHRVGDEVEVQTPAGSTKLTISQIR